VVIGDSGADRGAAGVTGYAWPPRAGPPRPRDARFRDARLSRAPAHERGATVLGGQKGHEPRALESGAASAWRNLSRYGMTTPSIGV
jgi:hypothetical protein